MDQRERLCSSELGKCWLRAPRSKQTLARIVMRMHSSSKMNSKRELHLLYSRFVLVWSSGAKAKLELSSEDGAVRASFEFHLGRSHAAPTDASTRAC